MSELEQVNNDSIIRLFPYPYIVVDRAAANALTGLLHLAPNIGRQIWKPESAGSGQHIIITPGGAQFIIIQTSALSTNETVVSIRFADKNITNTRRSLEIVSQLLDFDLDYEQRQAFELRQQQDISEPVNMEQIKQHARLIGANRKRRGPEPKPYNAWARDQAHNGRKIDDPDFLDEYMQQRGDDPTDMRLRERAREALRKTLERDQKI